MSDLTPKARALLDRARSGYEPSDADRARVRGRIGRKLALGVAAAGTVGAASKTAAAGGTTAVVAGSGGFLVKAALSVALVGTVSVGAATLVSKSEVPRSATPRAVVSARALETVEIPPPPLAASVMEEREDLPAPNEAVPAPPAPREVVPAPPAPREAVPALPSPREAPSPIPRTVVTAAREKVAPVPPPAISAEVVTEVGGDPVALRDEIDLLARAHEALGSSNGTLALALAEQHARRFPKSALTEERAAVRVFALCTSGRTLDARREASSFLQNHPRSPLADRVRSSCSLP